MKIGLFKNIALIFISIIFSILLCEVVSRIVYKIDLPHFINNGGGQESLFVPDKELGFRNKRNFDGWLVGPEYKNRIFTNNDGFRGKENFAEGRRGHFRIMAFGDSFTFGVGVEENETYVKKLANYIQNEFSFSIDAFNFGVGAYGTIQEFLLFQKFKYLKPDLVIVGFLARNTFAEEGGNDLVDNYTFYRKYIKSESGRSESYIPVERRTRYLLRYYSNLYRLVELKCGGFFRKKYLPEKANVELKEMAWQITGDHLRKFDECLQEMNVPGLLLWVPFPGSAANNDNSVPNIISKMGLKKLILVNPLDKLASNSMEYYYPLDGHWNRRGHEIASQLLFQKILETKILDNYGK